MSRYRFKGDTAGSIPTLIAVANGLHHAETAPPHASDGVRFALVKRGLGRDGWEVIGVLPLLEP